MDNERIDFLLNAYFDGALTPQDAAELERRLFAEPQARARFWELARFHAALREWGSRDWGRQLGAAEALGDSMPCVLPSPEVEADLSQVESAAPRNAAAAPILRARRWARLALPLAACLAIGLGF